jgi:hypothetical protein
MPTTARLAWVLAGDAEGVFQKAIYNVCICLWVDWVRIWDRTVAVTVDVRWRSYNDSPIFVSVPSQGSYLQRSLVGTPTRPKAKGEEEEGGLVHGINARPASVFSASLHLTLPRPNLLTPSISHANHASPSPHHACPRRHHPRPLWTRP